MPREIYLKQWDEASFAIAEMKMMAQRAVIREHWQQLTNEVVRRWRQVAPVQASEINKAKATFR